MRTETTHQYPARLEGTRRRFDRWRATREGRARIPERLWSAAVKAASQYGVSQVSLVLRLDYYSLKKRVEAAGRSGPSPEGGSGHTPEGTPRTGPAAGEVRRGGFIELTGPTFAGFHSAGAPECLLELEDPRGAKMRVGLKGVGIAELTAFSRSLWNSVSVTSAAGAGA